MDALNLFMPLTKVDAVQRLVFLTMTAERPDKSGEILDYATAKPAIQKWSDGISAASGGESLGNVRLMHGKTAIGKLVKLDFVDDDKRVDVCVKVVDDAAWKLVEERVLTGGSIGGGYEKRWPDPANRALKRYTPSLSEFSLVDNPCLPEATFAMVKADGVEEEVHFAPQVHLFEPTNEAVKALAGELAKAAGKDRPQDFVVQARADLIKRHADEAMAILPVTKADDLDELEKAVLGAQAALQKAKDPKKPFGDVEYADPKAGKYPIDTPAHIRAAWSYVNMPKNAEKLDDPDAVKAKIVAAWKAKIDSAGPPSAEKADFIADLIKSGGASILLKGIVTVSLEKGFYTVGRTAALLDRMSEIAQGVIWEEAWEKDEDSTLPQGILDLMASTRSFLIDMVNEETAEFFAQAEKDGGDSIALLAPCLDVDGMEMSAKVGELQKLHGADAELMAKVGAKISNANMKHVQAMHDHSAAMGAKCDSGNCDKSAPELELAKLAPLQDELARARRVIAGAIPQIQALTKAVDEQADAMEKLKTDQTAELATLRDQVEKLGKGPGLAKGVTYAIPKELDDRGVRQVVDPTREVDAGGAPTAPIARREWALAKLNGGQHAGPTPRSIPAPGGGMANY